MSKELTSLPNIGKLIAKELKEAGIETADELIAAGSTNAFTRIRTIDEGACMVKLMALEGAVRGMPLRELDPAARAELKTTYEQIKATHKNG